LLSIAIDFVKDIVDNLAGESKNRPQVMSLIMAENESLDLGTGYAKRWDSVFAAVDKRSPCGEVASKISKALYGGVNRALKQFREQGVPISQFLAGRESRERLRQLVRKTEGHQYAQLLESAAHASGPSAEECVRGWVEAILDRVVDQICHRVAGTGNWQSFFDVKAFTDQARQRVAADVEHIVSKLSSDPDWRPQPKRTAATRETSASRTEELLGMSLLGVPKS
jgi:hypothetical protein